MSVVTKGTRGGARPLEGDEAAKRNAAVVLEVLAGLRSPTEGSAALGVTAMRYYVLERRALEGMVQALGPRPKGKRKRPEAALAELEREKTRLVREVGRLQALVRAAERTMRLPPPPTREKKAGEKRRVRRPQVRAEKTVALLRAPSSGPTPASAPEVGR
jgi:hypothetical protein